MVSTKRGKKGQFVKGGKGGPGRPKGAKGKIGLDFVLGMQEAYYKLGGVRWLVDEAKKSNENARTFMRIMSQFIPQQTLQMILWEDARKQLPDQAQIIFQSVEVPQLEARVEQLETLLKEKKIALPKAEPLKELPESVPERTSEGISLQGETTDQGKKLLPEKTSEKKAPEIAPKRQLSAAERLRLRQAQEDSESWAVTKDD